jgi:hypothetical protein
MKNLTIALDENLVTNARQYASRHRTTLNGLIRKLLQQTVSPASDNWVEECFAKMDAAAGDSKGRKWKREDLYAR